MSGPVRLSDVAKAAGVSLGTASNVFNKPEQVRPEVRTRVETAARELGYHGPDPKGRLLMGGKVRAVGVVTLGAQLSHPFRSVYGREFMAGVAEVCDEIGAQLTLVSGLAEGREWGVRNAIVDGFILQRTEDASLLESIKRRKLPFVVVDADAGPDVSSVRIDDRGGARAQVRHLLGLGHRRFVFNSVLREDDRHPIFHAPGEGDHQVVGGSGVDRDRLASWAEVLAEVGISIRDVPIVEIAWGKNLDEGIAMLIDKAPQATAVVTGADDGALLLIEEIGRASCRERV